MYMLHFPSHWQKQTRQERYVSCNIIWRHIQIFATWFVHLICSVLILIILYTVLKITNIPTKSAYLYIFISIPAFTEWIHCLETKDCWLAYGLQYIYSVYKQNVMQWSTMVSGPTDKTGITPKNKIDLFIYV
jgi:hypothetical protein